MTKEIMEIMDKATQKYLNSVKKHGMNNCLEKHYSKQMDDTKQKIINDVTACVSLGIISQSLVDTLESQLRRRISTVRKQADEIYLQDFCGGSEHEADVQYWMYHEGWERQQAENFVNYLEKEEE